MKDNKFTIAVDIDDCICNTVDMDFAFGYHYAKEKNLFDEQINYDNQYFYVPKTFNMSENEALEFFKRKKA